MTCLGTASCGARFQRRLAACGGRRTYRTKLPSRPCSQTPPDSLAPSSSTGTDGTTRNLSLAARHPPGVLPPRRCRALPTRRRRRATAAVLLRLLATAATALLPLRGLPPRHPFHLAPARASRRLPLRRCRALPTRRRRRVTVAVLLRLRFTATATTTTLWLRSSRHPLRRSPLRPSPRQPLRPSRHPLHPAPVRAS